MDKLEYAITEFYLFIYFFVVGECYYWKKLE